MRGCLCNLSGCKTCYYRNYQRQHAEARKGRRLLAPRTRFRRIDSGTLETETNAFRAWSARRQQAWRDEAEKALGDAV